MAEIPVSLFLPRNPQTCPCCATPLPTGGEPRLRDLQIAPAHCRSRNTHSVETEPVTIEVKCVFRICSKCATRVAYVEDGRGWVYAFGCILCRTFTSHLTHRGWCMACVLSRACGVDDPYGLYSSLKEPLRERSPDPLDSMLRWLLHPSAGPLLTVPDPV